MTTRIIPFFVGNPYKSLLATVTGKGLHPRYIFIYMYIFMWYLFDMFWYLLRGLFIVNNTYSKFEFNLQAKSANKDHHLSVPRVLIGAVCQARSESEWIVKASKIFCLPNSLSSSAKLGETCWNSAYSANLAVVSIPFRGGGFKHFLFCPYLGKWSKIYPNWLILFKRVSEKPPPIFSFGASSLKDSDHKSETIWVSLCQKKTDRLKLR